jgi:hypothetical protein
MVACAMCGERPAEPAAQIVTYPELATAESSGDVDDVPPLGWVTSTENGRRLAYCPRCARDNVRAIESKLDSAWW